MKKIQKSIVAILLVVAVIVGCSLSAVAIGKTEPEKTGSATVHFCVEDFSIPGATFRFYRIASIDAEMNFTPVEQCADFPIDWNVEMDDDDWKILTTTVEGYVLNAGIAPVAEQKTDADGKAKFTDLETGLYLVLSKKVRIDDMVYRSAASLVTLPGYNEDKTDWNYDIVVEPKPIVEIIESKSETFSQKVLKKWDDNGYENKRPQYITVRLLANGNLYDEVQLNEAGNWKYEWENLAKYDAYSEPITWTIVEVGVQNYTVQSGKEGITYIIKNTYKPTTPPENPPKKSNDLPKTGVLWWPVGAALVLGLCFLALGIVRRKSHK